MENEKENRHSESTPRIIRKKCSHNPFRRPFTSNRVFYSHRFLNNETTGNHIKSKGNLPPMSSHPPSRKKASIWSFSSNHKESLNKTLCDHYQDVPEKHKQQEIGRWFGVYRKYSVFLLASAWRIIPFSKWLITMVSKSQPLTNSRTPWLIFMGGDPN